MSSKQSQRSQPNSANQSTPQSEQPEEGTTRSPEEKQIRGRSTLGTERIEQSAGDDIGDATEEA